MVEFPECMGKLKDWHCKQVLLYFKLAVNAGSKKSVKKSPIVDDLFDLFSVKTTFEYAKSSDKSFMN